MAAPTERLRGGIQLPLIRSEPNYRRSTSKGFCVPGRVSYDCGPPGSTTSLTHNVLVKRASPAPVPLISTNNVVWHIEIGANEKTYKVLVDTGSADLILLGVDCQDAKDLGKMLYDPAKAQKLSEKELTISYGDDYTTHVKGYAYTDTVTIGGLTATEQGVLVANKMGGKFIEEDFDADGILGVGFQRLAYTGKRSLFQTLYRQKQIKAPVFGFLLRASKECYSELSIGEPNEALIKGGLSSIIYVPVIERKYWKITVDAVTVNNVKSLGPVTTIIDTGATHIHADPALVSDFYKSIPNAKADTTGNRPGYYTIPCERAQDVHVGFVIGGSGFNIPPSAFSWKENGMCYGSVVEMHGRPNTLVVGGALLNHVYLVFDASRKDPKVGFAPISDPVAAC